jgi:hypothetical protein
VSGGLQAMREFMERTRGARVVVRKSGGDVHEFTISDEQSDEVVALIERFGVSREERAR